jgi:excisionase family DNA binding protein
MASFPYILFTKAMTEQGLTITQAAKILGVSPKTIRRHIKDGKIPYVLVQGKFGEEYRIFELPPVLGKEEPTDSTGQDSATAEGSSPAENATAAENNLTWAIDLVNDLQKTNLQLAAQLGAAQERIRELESRLQLLTAGNEPWWRRLLRKLGIK